MRDEHAHGAVLVEEVHRRRGAQPDALPVAQGDLGELTGRIWVREVGTHEKGVPDSKRFRKSGGSRRGGRVDYGLACFIFPTYLGLAGALHAPAQVAEEAEEVRLVCGGGHGGEAQLDSR